MKTAHTPIVLGVLIVGLLCDRAWAQSPQPVSDSAVTLREGDKPWNRGISRETQDAAEALFLEGNRLFRVPLFAQAAAKYTDALRTWQHPGFYYNLALAQLNLGQDVEARDNLERALRYGEDPLGSAQFKEGEHQLRELERQLGQIRVTCQTPGAVVTLDGVALFTAPGSRTAWVIPKTHEITARKTDYLSESRQVTVASGKLEQIDLRLITLNDAADANRRWATWKPWTVVAVGGAIAAAGGVFHLVSNENADQYGKEFHRLGCAQTNDEGPPGPPMPPGCGDGEIPPDLTDQLARARRQQKIAIGGYVAGGTVAAIGIVLLVLNRPRLAEQSLGSSGNRVSVMPTLSPDMFGVVVRIGP